MRTASATSDETNMSNAAAREALVHDQGPPHLDLARGAVLGGPAAGGRGGEQNVVRARRRIDEARGDAGLSSAVRVWILDYFRNPRTDIADTAVGGRRFGSAGADQFGVLQIAQHLLADRNLPRDRRCR